MEWLSCSIHQRSSRGVPPEATWTCPKSRLDSTLQWAAKLRIQGHSFTRGRDWRSRGLTLYSPDTALRYLGSWTPAWHGSDPGATGFPSPKSPVSPPPWQDSSVADLSHLCAYYYRLIKNGSQLQWNCSRTVRGTLPTLPESRPGLHVSWGMATLG